MILAHFVCEAIVRGLATFAQIFESAASTLYEERKKEEGTWREVNRSRKVVTSLDLRNEGISITERSQSANCTLRSSKNVGVLLENGFFSGNPGTFLS